MFALTKSGTSKARRMLARLLVALTLTAGLVAANPGAAQAAGDCYGFQKPYFVSQQHVDSYNNKWREITIKCYAGPGRPALQLGIVQLLTYSSGNVYVQVCDSYPDGIGPRIHVRWYSGATWSYADYQGYDSLCRTHRLGVNDTASAWKYVTYHANLQRYYASWDGVYSGLYEWPLHSF